MNTELVTHPHARREARAARPARRVHVSSVTSTVTLRRAVASDATALHTLIEAHLTEGHLLPRTLSELRTHAARFIVAVRDCGSRPMIVGCVELAPLSSEVAEVRSLVVDRSSRAIGVGRQLIDELRRSAVRAGFDRLCAFTHEAGFFVRKGFSIVPHDWLPEKIARDCVTCPLFRACGQHAVLLSLRS